MYETEVCSVRFGRIASRTNYNLERGTGLERVGKRIHKARSGVIADGFSGLHLD